MTNPYRDLGNAIVVQAVRDYRESTKLLKRKGKKLTEKKTKELTDLIKDVEEFLMSDWYKLITKIDGEELLHTLREEASRL